MITRLLFAALLLTPTSITIGNHLCCDEIATVREGETTYLSNIKKEFKKKNAWGMHTTIDLYGCIPCTIRDKSYIEWFTYQLCQTIGMKPYGETVVVHFGEEERVAGYSMYQLIETSNISAHFANESNTIYLDIFSCKPYDPLLAAQLTQQVFGAESYQMNIFFRK